jgi:hypothetical protein
MVADTRTAIWIIRLRCETECELRVASCRANRLTSYRSSVAGHLAAVVTGWCLVISGPPQPVTQLVLLSSAIYLRLLSPEEQAEYRKTLPDFELKIQDRYSDSNSTKKD